jgi:hypothetical protein
MKITKQQLKSIVKECLVEILAEGIGSKSIVEASKPVPTKQQQPALHAQHPTTQNQREIPNTVRTITSDPIMASILADTARTTLMMQEQADKRPSIVGQGVDRAAMVMSNVEPSEVFDEATMNMWARAAFEPKNS